MEDSWGGLDPFEHKNNSLVGVLWAVLLECLFVMMSPMATDRHSSYEVVEVGSSGASRGLIRSTTAAARAAATTGVAAAGARPAVDEGRRATRSGTAGGRPGGLVLQRNVVRTGRGPVQANVFVRPEGVAASEAPDKVHSLAYCPVPRLEGPVEEVHSHEADDREHHKADLPGHNGTYDAADQDRDDERQNRLAEVCGNPADRRQEATISVSTHYTSLKVHATLRRSRLCHFRRGLASMISVEIQQLYYLFV